MKLAWHDYEAGVDRGVFYAPGGRAEPWNGLISVTEEPTSDLKENYIDGVKISARRTLGEFDGTIRAYTYPDGFYEDVLTARRVKPFGMSYRVQSAGSYKIHLVYNMLLAPGEIDHTQSEVDPFSWKFTSKPTLIPDGMIGSHLIVDADKAYPWAIEALEDILYGTDEEEGQMPSPVDIFETFEEQSLLRVVDNGDGTFTVTGPDEVILMLSADIFEISWPSAELIGDGMYRIQSL